MSAMTAQTIDMIKMLPEEELSTVNALLKIIVRSWDPDFTKVTPEEREKLNRIDREIENGETYSEEEVWS